MMLRNKEGQSVLEYALVLAVIIAAIVLVIFRAGGMKSQIEAAYMKSGDALTKTTADLTEGVFK